ncbi:MAG: hypothetical protein R2828_32485 [Saprospiraceae bacterium]
MGINEIKIVDDKLILPKRILNTLKWKYPFYRIPKLKEYSKKIIDFSKENNQLPFFSKFDINGDGKDEVMIIHKSIISGYGRMLLISEEKGKFKFERIKWRRPVSSLFFDYLIDEAKPREYQTFGFIGQEKNEKLDNSMKSKKIKVKYSHIITKGYLTRVVYWNGEKYCQERISTLNFKQLK